MKRTQNSHFDYDIIIIGAGISGLSTGLAWSKVYDMKSNKALIIERQPIPGGCVSTFARKGYIFDTVQIIPDLTPVLNFLGVEIDLVRFNNNLAKIFLADPLTGKSTSFAISSVEEKFKKDLSEKFPEDRENIDHFFDYCNKMHRELRYLKTEPNVLQLFSILTNCPKILSNSEKTYETFLNKFRFRNKEVYEILDLFSSFSGLSADRCAALLTACAMVTTLKGGYRPEKGFIHFPVRLKKEFINRGGEMIFGVSVTKILTENGSVCGVELEDGRQIRSKYVVSTADTKVTFEKLLGLDILENAGKNYCRKVREAKMSPSSIAIHIGLDNEINISDYGVDGAYNVITTGRATHKELFNLWEQNILLTNDEKFHFALYSPSLVTGGKQTLVIHVVPAPAEYWTELRKENYQKYLSEKQKVAEFYIEKVEKYLIPDLRKHITMIDVSTPATYARYIGSPTGSNYDMMPVPENFGKNRLKVRTPVKNLFLPKFSHGIWPSVQAGLQITDMISGGKIMNGNSSFD